MMLLLTGLAMLVAGGILATFARGGMARILYVAFAIAGCVTAAVGPATVLFSGKTLALAIPSAIPGGDWRFGIDALSAIFLLAVLAVGALCAVFGANDASRAERPSGFMHLSFATLVASIALVVTARSVVAFLGAWEVMAISSYVLIVTHHEDAGVRRAGLIYLVATHTATLALFAMFATWAGPAADWSFDALAATSASLDGGTVTVILLLALVGFGVKAGCLPMHFWLPPAHAAAPSHVSALMSGIVIKTGIYGLLRVLLMLGGAPVWWGWLVFGIGVGSAFLGVLWALAQHDVKRLLAYHSVENIGIILMGIGVGSLGASHGARAVAMLGFAGALLHTVNHALFKSLLFLGAGAVYRATGTRNMEELGGLARRMPYTWIGFAVGAAAIIGVPPFNGFVSEWLVYQGMFTGADSLRPLRMALVGIPALALVGALALACFAKVSGVMFLGVPRGPAAARAFEHSGGYWPILALAAACIVLGVVPSLGIALVSRGAAELSGAPGAVVPDVATSGANALTTLALGMLAFCAALWGLRLLLVRRRIVRHAETWACGFEAVTPRMQYTASSFAAPLLDIFGRVGGQRIIRSPSSVHTHAIDLVLDGAVLPAWEALLRVALRIRAAQHGRLHVYLLYVMAAVIVMLVYLSLGPR
jgi:hydrogenase-4 component B